MRFSNKRAKMISEELALRQILDAVEPLDPALVSLSDARGRFAASDVFARWPLPMFDNSSMDGYAVRACDCAAAGARLRVRGVQPAGAAKQPEELCAGGAIRIFTGAPIPRGADTVVMQEDVRVEKDGITVLTPVKLGENIRRAGGDLCEGQKIVSRGDAVTPQLSALLASQDMAEIKVRRAPRVSVLTTGDELLAAGDPVSAGKIYESNSVMLRMLALNLGAEVSNLGIASDEPDALHAKLEAGCESDVLIVSGGVSVGERDLVKSAEKNGRADRSLARRCEAGKTVSVRSKWIRTAMQNLRPSGKSGFVLCDVPAFCPACDFKNARRARSRDAAGESHRRVRFAK